MYWGFPRRPKTNLNIFFGDLPTLSNSFEIVCCELAQWSRCIPAVTRHFVTLMTVTFRRSSADIVVIEVADGASFPSS